jgi:hypothetical protein
MEMDGHRFDDLARALIALGKTGSGSAPRRRLLGLLTGGALAMRLSGVSRAGPGGCRLVNQKCKKSANCCEGASCRKGKCRCKLGRPDLDHDGICDPPECLAATSPCEPDGIPCCGASTCTGLIDGVQVCCGVSIWHECKPKRGVDPTEYCCSGTCRPDGQCA